MRMRGSQQRVSLLLLLLFCLLHKEGRTADEAIRGSEEEVLRELLLVNGNLDETLNSNSKTNSENQDAFPVQLQHPHQGVTNTRISSANGRHFCGTAKKQVSQTSHTIRYTRLQRETYHGLCKDHSTSTLYNCVQWRVEPKIASRRVMKPVMADVPLCCDGWTGEDCSTSIVKDGYCPSRSMLLGVQCGLHCRADADCGGFEKCCNTTCGRFCVLPTLLLPAAEHARNLERAVSASPFSFTSPATQPALHTQIALSQMDRSSYHALCSLWGFDHMRAFNNRWVNFTGGCQYTLVKTDKVEIAFENTDTCLKLRTTSGCQKRLFLRLKGHGKDIDVSVFKAENRRLPTVHMKGKDQHIPAKIGHAFFEHVGGYVVVFGNNWKILFDYEQGSIHILSAKVPGGIDGLCGNMANLPGHVANDQISVFEEKWKRPSSMDSAFCSQVEVISYKGEDPCLDSRLTPAQREVARLRCSELNGTAFADCHTVNQTVLPLYKFLEACERDVCAGILDGVDSRLVPCSTATEYARQCKMFCASAASSLSWRRSDFCNVQCGKDQVYRECDSTCPKSCSSVNADPSNCNDHCIDGCVCKDSLYVNNTLCYQKDQCSCSYLGKLYNPSSVVKQRCSTCTCMGGNWNCTQKDCEGTCSITGNTRIISLDARIYYYSFAECTYDVIRATSPTSSFSVEVSFGPCASLASSYCIRDVAVYWGKDVQIILRKTSQTIVDKGDSFTALPYASELPSKLVSVINASTHFRRIEISDTLSPDLVVEWNGAERLYIMLDDSYKALSGGPVLVKGLCGNYDGNTGNDFDPEQTAVAFGDSQRTPSSLGELTCNKAVVPSAICGDSVEITKKTCGRLLQSAKIFGGCWNAVPLTGSAFGNLVATCEKDVCNCPDQALAGVVPGQSCLCQSLSTYAHLCALSGVRLDWRLHFPACRVSCPPNQRYKECGQPCPKLCPMMLTSQEELCNRTECLEGCECEPGFLHDKTPHGQCVAPEACSCVDNGKAYSSRDIIVRNISGTAKQCECKSGHWDCVPYVPGQLNCTGGMVHMTCVSPCQPTCGNQKPSHCLSTDCIDRCACPDGQYQVSEKNKTCVTRDKCPCTYGTKLFASGFVYPNNCNNCTCHDGAWACTNVKCRGFCAATGDPHYETFDGLRYSFQGQTKYVLAQYGSKLNQTTGDQFRILAENVDCGEDGVTCTKSVEIHLMPIQSSGVSSYIIKLDQELRVTVNGAPVKPPYDVCSARIIYNNLFLIVEDDVLKFKVSWDGSMRVYVEVDPCYGGLMEGLCGNFDGDSSNDLQARSGIQEANVYAFGNSWKVDANALDTPLQYNSTCDLKGGLRRLESKAICEEALLSSVFAECRNVIDVAYYLERCIDSTCACDKPGDDRCKCTSIAHYAHMCSRKSVCVLWREQFGCPMQCTGKAEYEACTCPNRCPGTRDKCTRMEFHEGCTCPLGTVYNGSECNPCPTCHASSLSSPVQVGYTSNGQECLSGHDDLTPVCAARPEVTCSCLPGTGTKCPPCYTAEVSTTTSADTCNHNHKCILNPCSPATCAPRLDPNTNTFCKPKNITIVNDGCCKTAQCSCPQEVACTSLCKYSKSMKTWNSDTCCYDYKCVCDYDKCPSFQSSHRHHVIEGLLSHQRLVYYNCSAGQCGSNTSLINTSCDSCCHASVDVYSCECDTNCNSTCSLPQCSKCEVPVQVKQPSMIGQECCPTYTCNCSTTKCDAEKAAFKLKNDGLIFRADYKCPQDQCLNHTVEDISGCTGCCSIDWYQCVPSEQHRDCSAVSIPSCSCEVKQLHLTYSNATCPCKQYTCGCINSSVCDSRTNAFILRHPANSTHMYNKSAACAQGQLVASHTQAVSSDGCGTECCNVSVYRCDCLNSTCLTATQISANAHKCTQAGGVAVVREPKGVYPDCCPTWDCGCSCNRCTPPPTCDPTCEDLSEVKGKCASSAYILNPSYAECCASNMACNGNTTKCNAKITAFKLKASSDIHFNADYKCPEGECLNHTREWFCTKDCFLDWYKCIPSDQHPNCSASPPSCPCEAEQANFTYNEESCCKEHKCVCVNSSTCDELKVVYQKDHTLQSPYSYRLDACDVPTHHSSAKVVLGVLNHTEAATSNGCGKSCCSVDIYQCKCNQSACHDMDLMNEKSKNCSRAGGVFRIDHQASGSFPDCCPTWKCGCNCTDCTPKLSCNECEDLSSAPGVCTNSSYIDNHGYVKCCESDMTCTSKCPDEPKTCPPGKTLVAGSKANGCCNYCLCNSTTCGQCPTIPTTLTSKCQNTTVTLGGCSTNASNATVCCDTFVTTDNEICPALDCSGQNQVMVPANFSAGSCCPTCMCNQSACHDMHLMNEKSTNCSRAGGVFRIDHQASGSVPDCCSTWKCGCNCTDCTPKLSCNECEDLSSAPGVCTNSSYIDNHGYVKCCESDMTCTSKCPDEPKTCPAGKTLVAGSKANGCCNYCLCNSTTCGQCPTIPITLTSKCQNTTVTLGGCSTNASNATVCCDTFVTTDNEICPALDCSGQNQVMVPANFSAGSCCPTCKCDCDKCGSSKPPCPDCQEADKLSDGYCSKSTLPLDQCCPQYNCTCKPRLCAAKQANYLSINPHHKLNDQCLQGECPERRPTVNCSDCCSFTPYECRPVKDVCDPPPACTCKGHVAIAVYNTPTYSSAHCCPSYVCSCVDETRCDEFRKEHMANNKLTIFSRDHICPAGSSLVSIDDQPVTSCKDTSGKDCCTIPVYKCECNCSTCLPEPSCTGCDRTSVVKKNGTCDGGRADQCCSAYDCLCPTKTFPVCHDSDIAADTSCGGCTQQKCKKDNPVNRPQCCCGTRVITKNATGSPCGCFNEEQCSTPVSSCPVDVSSATDLTQYCPSDFKAVKDKVPSTTCPSFECGDCGHCQCNVSCLSVTRDICGANCHGCATKMRKSGDFSTQLPLSWPVAAATFNCCVVYKECDTTLACPKKTCDGPCEDAVLVANATGDPDSCGCCPTYACKRRICPDLGPLPTSTPVYPCVEYNMTIDSNTSCGDSCCGCRTVAPVPCNCTNATIPSGCPSGSCPAHLTTATLCDGTIVVSTKTPNPNCTSCPDGSKADCSPGGCCKCREIECNACCDNNDYFGVCAQVFEFDAKTLSYTRFDCLSYLTTHSVPGGYAIAQQAHFRGMMSAGTCNVSQICADCISPQFNCNVNHTWVAVNATDNATCCKQKLTCTEKECAVCPKVPCCDPPVLTCGKCHVLENFTNADRCLEYKCVPKPCEPDPPCASPSCNMTVSGETVCGCTVLTCKCPPTTTKPICCPAGRYPKLYTPATNPENCTCPPPEYRCEDCIEDRLAFLEMSDCPTVNDIDDKCPPEGSKCPIPVCDPTKCSTKTCVLPYVRYVTRNATLKGCDCCDSVTCDCPAVCPDLDDRSCTCNETSVIESDGCCNITKCVDRCSREKCPSLSCAEVDRFLAHPGDCCQRCKEVTCTSTCPPIPAACQATNPYTTTMIPPTMGP